MNSEVIPQSYVTCEINFGLVPVGKTVIKTFKIKNNRKEPINYIVTRNTETNPIYYVFDVDKYEALVKPGDKLNLRISYSPNIPGCRNLDYFKIIDSDLNLYRVCSKGDCIGPKVKCSVKYLHFLQTPDRCDKKLVFELKNSSTVPAIFQFDDNDDHCGIFQLEQLRGTVEPQTSIYIGVKFAPKAPGFYSRQLACLILHHEPILLGLFGCWSINNHYDLSESHFRHYRFPLDDCVGFKGFLSDSVLVKTVPPPVSLSCNFLDFGRIIPCASCQTLTTSLTNHMEDAVEVDWENGKLFQAVPGHLVIPPKQSALYECKFTPEVSRNLSSTILYGHVTWTARDNKKNAINIPIPINLRLIGHSFPKNESWIPLVIITPPTVILPLTLPNNPSWTTFMMHSQSHLPVLFRFLPPEKTNFLMKPMVGLIRDYQIVVVQLQTTRHKKASYVERWNIELNGQEERLMSVYLKGQTDVPTIIAGMNNYIEFEPMQPGSVDHLYIPIRNPSSCHLEFEFKLKECPNLFIEPAKWELAPNEEVFTNWYYSALGEEGLYKFEVTCQVQAMLNGQLVVGTVYELPITVITWCIYSELCAMPRNYDAGEIKCGADIKTRFYLYNFGESALNFTLCSDFTAGDIVFKPTDGRCGPKEKMLISVECTVKKVGKNTINIGYYNRMSNKTKEKIPSNPLQIYSIDYNAIYPMVMIGEIIEHDFGHLFSNLDLWEIFAIDQINAAFSETVQGEIRRITVNAPESEMRDKEFHIVFSLRNITNVSTSVFMKRIKICTCEYTELKESVTFRQKTVDCVHRKSLSIELSHPTILAKSDQLLTLKIKYSFPNDNTMSYMFHLSNDRCVILNIVINTIPVETMALSCYKANATLNLGYIYIGLRDAPVQAFWLYNNTYKSVPYRLDDREIVKLCNCDGFTVLKCLNRTGFLKPQSAAPLLFRFWPIEVKPYLVVVNLALGMRQVSLKIQGWGTDKIGKHRNFSTVSRPLNNQLLHLSIDHLVVEPIVVGSSIQRLFFIKNPSKTHDIKYEWKPCAIAGLIKIEVSSNTSGILEPKETHSVILNVTSLNEPCSLRVSLVCECYDHTLLELHEQTKNAAYKKKGTVTEEFIIGEDGTEIPVVQSVETVKIEPRPESLKIALPITINVIGILDKDTCLSLDRQLMQKPSGGIYADVEKFVDEYLQARQVKEQPIWPVTEKNNEVKTAERVVVHHEIVQNVLECLVADAVFNDSFYEKMMEMKNEPSPLYSQIRLEPKYRSPDVQRGETLRSLSRPNLAEVANVFDELVVDSIHQTFHLGPPSRKQKDNS